MSAAAAFNAALPAPVPPASSPLPPPLSVDFGFNAEDLATYASIVLAGDLGYSNVMRPIEGKGYKGFEVYLVEEPTKRWWFLYGKGGAA